MTEFFIIIKEIILRIFIIIMLGFAMQKKFALHVQTLAKINIYLLVPGFIFVKLYRTEISVQLFANILLFFILYCVILFIIAQLVGKLIGLRKGKKTTFTNSVMFFNSGNYGVPVNDLVFHSDPVAMSVQVIVLTLQNIFLFSYGIFSLASIKVGKLKAAFGYFKMPVLYVRCPDYHLYLGTRKFYIGCDDCLSPVYFGSASRPIKLPLEVGNRLLQFIFTLNQRSVDRFSDSPLVPCGRDCRTSFAYRFGDANVCQ